MLQRTLATSTDRRGLPRYTCSLSVLAGENLCEAPVRDLSAQGMSFVLDHQLEPGTCVGIEMYSLASEAYLLKGGRVAHATEQPDGWLTGIFFPESLTEADLRALVGHAPRRTSKNQRLDRPSLVRPGHHP